MSWASEGRALLAERTAEVLVSVTVNNEISGRCCMTGAWELGGSMSLRTTVSSGRTLAFYSA